MIGNKMRLGGKRLVDRTTPTTVVASDFTPSANARIHKLTNGWWALAAYNTTTASLVLYISKDDGGTWTAKTIGSGFSQTPYFASASYGNMVWVLYNVGTTTLVVQFYNGDSDSLTSSPTVASSQTGFSGVSIASNPSNGQLTGVWSSKTSTYPNSFNISSAKSVDGGSTWTKQDGTAGFDQITTWNSAGYDMKNPCVAYMNNDKPVTAYEMSATSSMKIRHAYYTTIWNESYIYDGNTYTQTNPTIDVSVTGVIRVAWQTRDATDSAVDNIGYSQSADNAASWMIRQKITSGNNATYYNYAPTITTDANDVCYILWWGKHATLTPTIGQILMAKGNVGSFVLSLLTASASATISYPTTCNNHHDFENPISAWKDANGTPSIKFYGKFYL